MSADVCRSMKRNGESLVTQCKSFVDKYGGSALLVIDCNDPRLDGPNGGPWRTQLVFTTEKDAFRHAKDFVNTKWDWSILRSDNTRETQPPKEAQWPRTEKRPWHHTPEAETYLLSQIHTASRQLVIDASASATPGGHLPLADAETRSKRRKYLRPVSILDIGMTQRKRIQQIDFICRRIRKNKAW